MEKFTGFIYSRLERINSRSQGPEYFLQTGEQIEDDIPIHKKANLWEVDSQLQKNLATIVSIDGEIADNKLAYKTITNVDSF